ncbi:MULTISPECIES: hypothetical protein [Streptomyces]|uniref:Big-1 domain-containing protein n=1 Tax=Streptomyces ramulosus TaxID=47762 RepID=A0ABW1FBF8_9ACTN
MTGTTDAAGAAGARPSFDHHDLLGAAPAAVAFNPADDNIWFVTADARIGRFVPRPPFEVAVFPPQFSQKQAGTLTTWDGNVWTYVHDTAEGRPAKCDPSGKYPLLGTGPAKACQAMAVAEDGRSAGRLIATLDGQKFLYLIDSAGEVEYSDAYVGGALHGLAVEEASKRCWVSCPGSKDLVPFDLTAGRFGSPLGLRTAPLQIALTESEGKRYLWAATPERRIVRRRLDDPGEKEIATPAPVGRFLALPGGTLWFTMPSLDAVGYILPGAETVTGTVPTGAGSRPSGITVADDGQLWVALEGTAQLFRVSKYQIRAVSGGSQAADLGETFDEPLVAQVSMVDGSSPADASVVFTVLGDNARFSGTQQSAKVPAKAGVATSPPLKAVKAGPFEVSAEWQGKDAVTRFRYLTVNPQAGSVDHVRHLSGAGQHTAPDTAFDQPLKVVVEDRNGIAVTARTRVTFTVTRGRATFEGAASAKTESDADGVAASPALTAGPTPGTCTVEAWAEGTDAGTTFREFID